MNYNNDERLDMLMVAVTNKNYTQLNDLFNKFNYSPFELNEAFIVAATIPKNTEILGKLLDQGATVDYENSASLKAAVSAGTERNAHFLLEQGATINDTLLHEAVESGNPEIVKILLVYGASPLICVNTFLPIELAAKNEKWDIVKILSKYTDMDAVEPEIVQKISEISKAKAFLESGTNIPSLRPQQPQPLQRQVSRDCLTMDDPRLQQLLENARQQGLQEGQKGVVQPAAGAAAVTKQDAFKLLQTYAKKGAQAILDNIDPQKIAEILKDDPQLLEKITKGELTRADIGTILQKYAGEATQQTQQTQQGKWIQAAGKFLAPPQRPQVVQGAKMPPSEPLATFEEQVEASATDLQNYPLDDVKNLAKQMNVPNVNGKQAFELYKDVARKIIYINNNPADLPSLDRSKCIHYQRTLSKAKLGKIRKTIYKKFANYKDSVYKMDTATLKKLFEEYDKLVFEGDIKKYMDEFKYGLEFKTSGEETFTTEGICTHNICNYTITIPTEYFKNVKQGRLTNVAGHQCKDQLECLLRVIEHELVHLIIFIFCGDQFITDQHGPLFMNMVKDLFGHTDHRHYIF